MKSFHYFFKSVFVALFLACLVFGFRVFDSVAQTEGRSDAIAIRIVPNPHHYTIEDWYAKQGFLGSPQKTIVDGYEAVRDNRTVYVAATNLVGTLLYNNIYIITYNENAATPTTDIFGKILAGWKFNINIPGFGSCSLPQPANICTVDADCPVTKEGYNCNTSTHRCESNVNCVLDSECPVGTFCTSQKAKLIRDIKRLQYLTTIKDGLAGYVSMHNKYPVLESGTFLPQVAISTWPSWQSIFTSQLNIPSVVDPINDLGLCTTSTVATSSDPGFDDQTCWNGKTYKFYNNGTAANLILPANSYAVVYTTDANGAAYNLCTNMETNYSFMSIDNVQTSLANSNCHTTAASGYTSTATNQAPQIVSYSLVGQYGQPFNGYIQAMDPEGSPITFSTNIPSTSPGGSLNDNIIIPGGLVPGGVFIPSTGAGDSINYLPFFDRLKKWLGNLIPTAWGAAGATRPGGGRTNPLATNWSTWDRGVGPVLQRTSDPNQIRLYSPRAGNVGTYSFTLTMTDAYGKSATVPLIITINPASGPTINAGDVDYNLSQNPNNLFQYSLYFETNDFGSLGLSYNIQTVKEKGILEKIAQVNSFIKQALFLKDVQAAAGTVTGTSGTSIHVVSDHFNSTGCVAASSINPWTITKDGAACIVLANGLFARLNSLGISQQTGLARYSLEIFGKITGNFSRDSKLNATLKIYNTGGNQEAIKNFTINLHANPPKIEANCSKKTAQYAQYECLINNLNLTNATTTYSVIAPNVPGLIAVPQFNGGAKIVGTPSNLGEFDIEVIATNEYQASSSVKFKLAVTKDCGQPIEYDGGPWNSLGDIKNGGGYYRTVQIGNQCWMADNLNTTLATGFNTQNQGSCYNNDSTYCEAEGRLYTWNDANQNGLSRGLCPLGWHIATEDDYQELINGIDKNCANLSAPAVPTVSSQLGVIGNGNSCQSGSNGCANDSNNCWQGSAQGSKLKVGGDSGFEGFLAGGYDGSSYKDRGQFGYFWTSNKFTSNVTTRVFRALAKNSNLIYKNTINPANFKLSARCVKNRPCAPGCVGEELCMPDGQCCSPTWTPAINSTHCGYVLQRDTTCESIDRYTLGPDPCSCPGQTCSASNTCSAFTPNWQPSPLSSLCGTVTQSYSGTPGNSTCPGGSRQMTGGITSCPSGQTCTNNQCVGCIGNPIASTQCGPFTQTYSGTGCSNPPATIQGTKVCPTGQTCVGNGSLTICCGTWTVDGRSDLGSNTESYFKGILCGSFVLRSTCNTTFTKTVTGNVTCASGETCNTTGTGTGYNGDSGIFNPGDLGRRNSIFGNNNIYDVKIAAQSPTGCGSGPACGDCEYCQNDESCVPLSPNCAGLGCTACEGCEWSDFSCTTPTCVSPPSTDSGSGDAYNDMIAAGYVCCGGTSTGCSGISMGTICNDWCAPRNHCAPNDGTVTLLGPQ